MATPSFENDFESKTDSAKIKYSFVHFDYGNGRYVNKVLIGHTYKQIWFPQFNFFKNYKIIKVKGDCSRNKSKNV